MASLFRKFKRTIFYKFGSPVTRANIIRERREIVIGKNCEIYNNVKFGSEPYLIEIGDQVRVTEGVRFITHDGGMWVLRNLNLLENADKFNKIVIGNNVHIGINSIIMPGVTIGDNVVIGVNSVVTKNIPSNTIAAGVPAKVINSIQGYYEKNRSIVDFTKNLNSGEKKEYLIRKYKDI